MHNCNKPTWPHHQRQCDKKKDGHRMEYEENSKLFSKIQNCTMRNDFYVY